MGVGDLSPVSEMIWAFVLADYGTKTEIETTWTIDDFAEAWIVKMRKAWIDEAQTLLMKEKQDEASKPKPGGGR